MSTHGRFEVIISSFHKIYGPYSVSSYLLWESVKYYLDDLVGGVKSVTPSSPKNWFVERGGSR